MINFFLVFNTSGKIRLTRFFSAINQKETQEIINLVLQRKQNHTRIVEYKGLKIIFKRYATLYFLCAVESTDNELLTFEVIHRYVVCLNNYFGNVCELDIIYNFEKAYRVLDELLVCGELMETSQKSCLQYLLQAEQTERESALYE